MTTVVFDVGKTNLKLLAVDAGCRVLEQLSQPNRTLPGPPWSHPDLAGTEAWLLTGLAGFTVRHRLEIISYVLQGALGHKDPTGTDGVIRPGDIQRMSAGNGIEHSEMNASASEPVHFLQIWVKPNKRGILPGYEQVAMPSVTGPAQLDLIAGPDGGEGAVTLHADARVYRASLQPGAPLDVQIPAARYAWVQVLRGDAVANGQPLATGDGLAISDEPNLSLNGGTTVAELLVFDLA